MEEKKVKVYNLIILDESGSMSTIAQAALSGLNETLQTIRKSQEKYANEQEHFITLVLFNGGGTKKIFDLVTADKIGELNQKDYNPDCNTPLYDAMGSSISRLRAQIDKNSSHEVLVTIITDGYENASREFTGKMIKQMVEEMKSEGWTFAYIGANQDVDAVADSISIQSKFSYQANREGTEEMFDFLRKSHSIWLNKVLKKSKGENIDVTTDFFEDDEAEK
jgi:Mg-chelatase subunit ChlD